MTAHSHMYGPGSPFNALKHRHVSSVITGPPICDGVIVGGGGGGGVLNGGIKINRNDEF